MKQIILIISTVLLLSSVIFTHGMHLDVQKSYPCIVVTSQYRGGSLLSYSAVKVFFENQEMEFQNGRTDKHGRFCFFPDKEGIWYFEVDDEMGHVKRLEIKIGKDFFSGKKTNQPQGSKPNDNSFLCKILLGLVLIMGLFFGMYFWKRRKEGQS